jgi:hypothetical protein
MEMFFISPPPTHFVYIPVILLVGAIIGFVIGRKAGIREGLAYYIGGEGAHEDDDLI